MRYLNISTEPPLVYKSQTYQDNKIYDETRNIKWQYRNNSKIKYKKDIWNRFKIGKEKEGVTIEKGLYELQNNKCCYCEQILDLETARLDHYRPREGYEDKIDANQCHKGYYWLAYDWNNFLVICEVCNNRKSSKFPISNPSVRIHDARIKIKLPEGTIGSESPLIINPRYEDPFDYYYIDESQINTSKEIYLVGIDTNTKGHKTIEEVVDLNRRKKGRGKNKKDFLMKKRFKIILNLRNWINMLEGHEQALHYLRIAGQGSACQELEESVRDIKTKILDLISDDSEFSGLCKKYIIQRSMQNLLNE